MRPGAHSCPNNDHPMMKPIDRTSFPANYPAGAVPPLDLSQINRNTGPASARTVLTTEALTLVRQLTTRSAPATQREALQALRAAWTAANRTVRMEENKNPQTSDGHRRELCKRLIERDLRAELNAAKLREQAGMHLPPLPADEGLVKKLEAELDDATRPVSARLLAGKRLADQFEQQGQTGRAIEYLQRALGAAPREAYPWE